MREIVEALRNSAIRVGRETDMQEDVERCLTELGIAFGRELRISDRDRLDFLTADGTAIECKVAGSQSGVLEQLFRYAESDYVTGIVLVASRVRLIPRRVQQINGKPLASVWVAPPAAL